MSNYCPSRNSIFWPNTAFSGFSDPRRRRATPVEDPVIFSGRSKKSCGLVFNQNLLFPDGHYTMCNMKKDNITHLYNSGKLSDIDIHFAKFISGLSDNDDPDILLAAALVSNATGNGDVYLDLVSASEKPIMGEGNGERAVICPKLSVWSQKISQLPAVGRPGDFLFQPGAAG